MHVRTHKAQVESAKARWKMKLEEHINPEHIFCTALAENLFPFALWGHEGGCPAHTRVEKAENVDGEQEIYPQLLSIKEMRIKGYFETANWFAQVETEWESRKKEGSKMTYAGMLDYHNSAYEATPSQTAFGHV